MKSIINKFNLTEVETGVYQSPYTLSLIREVDGRYNLERDVCSKFNLHEGELLDALLNEHNRFIQSFDRLSNELDVIDGIYQNTSHDVLFHKTSVGLVTSIEILGLEIEVNNSRDLVELFSEYCECVENYKAFETKSYDPSLYECTDLPELRFKKNSSNGEFQWCTYKGHRLDWIKSPAQVFKLLEMI